jgi:AcrR family transcriptional regulator
MTLMAEPAEESVGDEARPASAGRARPGTPRWARLEPDARRAQILHCARELFATRSYTAVSMEDIALAAGVRRGLVNHYFGSKRGLFIDVVREMLGGFATAFPLPDRDGPLDAVVASHIARWLDVVEADVETWFAILGAEGLGRDADVQHLVEKARDAMVEGVVEVLGPLAAATPTPTPAGGKRSGRAAKADATGELRVVLRAYSGLAEIVTREWLQRRTIDRAQAEALLTAALLGLVRDVVPVVRAARG